MQSVPRQSGLSPLVGLMPKPPMPRELKACAICGKVQGDYKGWFGPQCFCDRPAGHAAKNAHSIGTQRGRIDSNGITDHGGKNAS